MGLDLGGQVTCLQRVIHVSERRTELHCAKPYEQQPAYLALQWSLLHWQVCISARRTFNRHAALLLSHGPIETLAV